jgi:type III pantothenate kinase
MLLLIDAGNTRVKWALAALPSPIATSTPTPGDWVASGAVLHAEVAALGLHWRDADISQVVVANVAGPVMQAALLAQILPATPRITWFTAAARVAGVINGYRAPQQLGCDRLAALIGARALYPDQALVVAMCGTATTVDALCADGRFIGGMILPGAGTMAASLALRTAQLPSVPLQGADTLAQSPFADHTEAAIRNGCLAAQAGAIERAVAAHGNAHCLLSGGAAAWVAPWLRVAASVTENLVLIGLHAFAIDAADVNANAITEAVPLHPRPDPSC